jgi:hypothetical protein
MSRVSAAALLLAAALAVVVPFFLKPFGIYLLSMWAAVTRGNRLEPDPRLRRSHEFAGAGASAEILQIARRIAEAQIDLRRTREVRHSYLSHAIGRLRREADRSNADAGQALVDLPKLMEEVDAIERYERRAFSRRKFATRELDLARRDS